MIAMRYPRNLDTKWTTQVFVLNSRALCSYQAVEIPGEVHIWSHKSDADRWMIGTYSGQAVLCMEVWLLWELDVRLEYTVAQCKFETLATEISSSY